MLYEENMTFNQCEKSNRRYLCTATNYSSAGLILCLVIHGILSCCHSISDAQKLQKNPWADYVHVIIELLDTASWNRYLLVTDEYAEVPVNQLLSATVASNVKVSQNTSDQQIVTRIIEAYNIRKNGQLDFLIFCEITCILRVVRQAQLFDQKLGDRTALAHMSRWIVVTQFHHKDVIENSLSNFNNVALITEHCVQSGANQQVMNKTAWTELRHRPTVNRISSNSTLYGQNTVNLASVYVLRGAGIKLGPVWSLLPECKPITMTGNDNNVALPAIPKIEIYAALWQQYRRRFNLIGQWSREQGIHVQDEVFPNLKFGLNSQVFNVVTIEWPVYVILNEKSGDYEGVCMEILKELSSMLNFTYRLYLPEDGEWGVFKEDGNWTGMIGELQHRRANLIAAPTSVTFEREQVIDFIYPFDIDYNVVIVKKRTDDEWKITRLFSYQIYVLIAVSLVLMSLLVYHCERMNPYYLTWGRSLEENQLHPFHNVYWYLFGALLWEGGNPLPTSQTGRTLLTFWWLYCLVLTATFGGQLIATLTLSKDVAPFNTLNEMVQQHEYTWGTLPGLVLVDLFKHSNLTVYKRVWDGLKTDIDLNNQMDTVKRGGHAYINDKSSLLGWTSEDCDLLFIREAFFPMPFAFGLPDESPYTNMFSEAMLKIIQSGLVEKWKKRWRPVDRCKRQVEVQARPIQLDDVQVYFYIIVAGVILGSLSLITEALRKSFF